MMTPLQQRIVELVRADDMIASAVADIIGTPEGYVSVIARRHGIDLGSRQPRSKDPALAVYRQPERQRISRPGARR